MINTLKNYTGNKSIEGLYQWIINRIPPHKRYYELFAGSAQIARRLPTGNYKRLIESNQYVAKILEKEFSDETLVIHSDAIAFLRLFLLSPEQTDIFMYLDPPYMLNYTASKKALYQYSMSDEEHKQLLSMVRTVECNCMISHPSCELYDDMLKGWTKESKIVRYHTRTTKEWIYYNYPKPNILYTYQYVGIDCWDRQRVKRKIDRLVKKLTELPPLERNAVIERVNKELSTFNQESLK